MAVPKVSDNPSTQQQYAAQLAVTAALVQSLRALWAAIRPTSSPQAMVRYREGVFVLVSQWAQVAGDIATDYYRDARLTADIPGPVKVPPVPELPRSLVDAGLDWALPTPDQLLEQAEARADEMLNSPEMQAQIEAMQAKVDAAMQKAVTDMARDQVTSAVEADDRALGYRRVPRPGACYFCVIQAIRSTTRKGISKDFKKYGPGSLGGEKHYGVYKSRGSAGASVNDKFTGDGEAKFHNNCHCVIEPVFAPATSLPDWLADMERLYDETPGGLNEFRKALKALREGEEPEPPALPAIAAANPPSEQIAALLDLLSQAA